MKALNQTSKKILGQLVGKLQDGYLKLDNAPGVFRPLVIEQVSDIKTGIIYSLAHYGEQNGDLMRNPDVCLLKTTDENYYPLDYRNDYVGVFLETVDYIAGEPVLVNAGKQAEITEFCDQWLQNIKQQQEI